jgi:serine/threonine protein kinase
LRSFFDDDSPEGTTEESGELHELSPETGVVLGTVGYMSPEQVRGSSIDGRSDIWSFGCLLFEMLSGKRAFRGRTPTDTLVQVLEGDPNWKALPPDVPPEIERLVRRCLRKDRNQRLQSIGDARIEIEDALTERDASRGAKAPSARKSFLLAGLLIGLAGGYFASRNLTAHRRFSRLSPARDAVPLRPRGRRAAALSGAAISRGDSRRVAARVCRSRP